MNFAQTSPGIWIFGAYRIERFQYRGVLQRRFRAKAGDVELGVKDSKDECVQLCATHRRGETLRAFHGAWNKSGE